MAKGTKQDPWALKTPPGTSGYAMYKDEQADPPALVCQVGSTTLRYHARAIEDLHAWLVARGWYLSVVEPTWHTRAGGSACSSLYIA